jgi:hypothetical protein
MLTFDIVIDGKPHRKKLVSATLKVSTLLKRVNAEPNGMSNSTEDEWIITNTGGFT